MLEVSESQIKDRIRHEITYLEGMLDSIKRFCIKRNGEYLTLDFEYNALSPLFPSSFKSMQKLVDDLEKLIEQKNHILTTRLE